mmetsp:Transcript_11039/g.28658  ORF Transcript_11039/g.28658 Transcript_11039/m.28658 type:complete len:211 (-) Transcript_11039:617-1249(-)
MGILNSLVNLMTGTRDYSDLKGWAAESATYATAGEVKEKSKDGHCIATFGGGCFWGVELLYQRVPGVIGTAVGYSQGKVEHPSYEAVCSGSTGHTEVVQLTYDPEVVTMKALTELLFTKINPKLKDQVGNDRGTQYRHGVYYHSEGQRAAAQEVFDKVKEEHDVVYTELEPAGVFYPAEAYHQQYLEKGGRNGSGQSAQKGCKDPIRCYG